MTTPIRIVDGPIATDELGRPVAALPIRYVEEPIATNEVGQPVDALRGEIVDSAVVTTTDGRVVGSVPARVVAGLVTANEVGNRAAVTPVWLGGDVQPPDPDPVYARTASANTAVRVHSGHSLTDAYMHHGPYPSILGNFLVSAGIMTAENYQDRHLKGAIPGSGVRARFEHDNDGTYFPDGPHAYADAGEHDGLMITEAGPPIRYDQPITERLFVDETLDYLARFVANQIENGKGTDVVLWSIWPHLAGAGATDESPAPTTPWAGLTAREALPIYSYHYRLKADYMTAKMRLLYPSLPSGWRVWMVPGHLFMQRVMDDFENGDVPGVTDFEQLMDRHQNGDPDGIHPGPWLMYGMSAMVAAALYQFRWSDIASPWVLPAYTAANGVEHLALPPATAQYMRDLADELNATYYHVGMGGTIDADPVWVSGVDEDPMPIWTLADPDTGPAPEPEPEPELPSDILAQVSPTAITGLTFSPTLPAAAGGFRTIAGNEPQSLVTGAVYMVVRGRRMTGGPIFATLGTSHQNWNADKLNLASHSSLLAYTVTRESPNEFVTAYPGVSLDTAFHTLEAWHAGGAVHFSVDGGPVLDQTTPAYAAFTALYLGLYGGAYDLQGLALMARIPTTNERAGLRELVATAI